MKKQTRVLIILSISLSLIFFMANSFISAVNFKEEQMKFPRVKTSYSEKETQLKALLSKNQLSPGNLNIFIRVFKEEGILEVWGKAAESTKFKLIKSYPVCSKSGTLGPKRKQGDFQVPEGFYHIDAFNPNSNFYLSMKVNYPNASDRILGVKGNLGDNICIHGNCVTVGCVPITDDLIKEVYILAIEAKNNGQQKIPVHIFPFKMTPANIKKASLEYDAALNKFWGNLKTGYDLFEKDNTIPSFTVNKSGTYIF